MSYFVNSINVPSPPHAHKNYELIIYVDGCGTCYTELGDFAVKKGDIIIMPPGVLHSSDPEAEVKRIYISGEFSHIFSLNKPAIIPANSDGEGITLAQIIYKNRHANHEYLASLCNAFAHFLLLQLNSENSLGLVIQEIISEMTEDFHNCNLDLHFILQKSGYAVDYVRAEFKKVTGKTPVEFLTDIRIKHARFLIDVYKDALSMTEIAERCGFADYIYFSRRFRQLTGVSPRKYKNSPV